MSLHPVSSVDEQSKSRWTLVKDLFRAFFTIPESGWLGVWFFISRFTWELPQHILGLAFSLSTILAGLVKEIYYFNGSIVVLRNITGKKGERLRRNKNLSYLTGVSLGTFLCVGGRASKHRLLAISQHEFGHYLQSRRWGWFYLICIGLPSIVSASQGPTFHRSMWWEKNANHLSENYHLAKELHYIALR